MAGLNQPLSDPEYDRLAAILERDVRAMNLEMVDGFFAALICSPDVVRPSEYLRVIWGGEYIGGKVGFRDDGEMQECFDLIMRHWNHVAGTLHSGETYVPFLLEDDAGVARANEWAQGFVKGMDLRRVDWADLLDDEEHGGLLVPILALAHEHHPDPEMRPYKEPMSAERREQLIVGIAASVPAIYRYFAVRRRLSSRAEQEAGTYRRPTDKVGRNDPCPCGSGKKFKKCCGSVTLH
jgi:uncharacterized protein